MDEKDVFKNPFREFLENFFKRKVAVISLLFIIFLVVIAIFQPVPYDLNYADYENLLAEPSSKHWFGTDGLGRDTLSRVCYGLRSILFYGVSTGIISVFIGVLFGYYAGKLSNKIDKLVTYISEGFFMLPIYPLVILILQLISVGDYHKYLIFLVPIFSWPLITPLLRNNIRQNHLSIQKIFVFTLFSISFSLSMISMINFIFGYTTTITLGSMVQSSIISLRSAWWLTYIPGLFLFLTIWAFNKIYNGICHVVFME